MSINEVPVLPLRAGRHLACWIVWHTVRVSWVEDEAIAPQPVRPRSRRRTKR